MNPQAEELNELLKKENHNVFDMLSELGKELFFPKKGILGQSADAKGKEINATIGIALEDDGSPLHLRCIGRNINLDPKEVYPYAPSFGKPELRKAWRSLMFEKNPSLNGQEISIPVVTNALTHGITTAADLFIGPNDEVIIPEPYWGNYNLMLKVRKKAKIITFPLFHETGFNIEGLREKIKKAHHKAIVLLNFPNNPTGYSPTNEEAQKICNMLIEFAESGKNLVVLLDDAYFGLVYEDGVYAESLFSKLANANERLLAVKLDGATKEDYVWGFRVGFITYGVGGEGDKAKIYEALENKTGGSVRGNISNCPHISQSLVLHGMMSHNYKKEKKEKFDLLKKRCDTVIEILKGHEEYKEYFEPLPFNSGYFMCVGLKKGINPEQVRQQLLNKYSTGIIALEPNIIRIAFSSVPTDKLAKLFDNLYNAVKEVNG